MEGGSSGDGFTDLAAFGAAWSVLWVIDDFNGGLRSREAPDEAFLGE
jgi:hypothetical protein